MTRTETAEVDECCREKKKPARAQVDECCAAPAKETVKPEAQEEEEVCVDTCCADAR